MHRISRPGLFNISFSLAIVISFGLSIIYPFGGDLLSSLIEINIISSIPDTIPDYQAQLIGAAISTMPVLIDSHTPPILHRLGLDETGYLEFVKGNAGNAKASREVKPRVIGGLEKIREVTTKLQGTLLNGTGLAKALYLASG